MPGKINMLPGTGHLSKSEVPGSCTRAKSASSKGLSLMGTIGTLISYNSNMYLQIGHYRVICNTYTHIPYKYALLFNL